MAWPDLPLGAWQETYETLHLWTQMVGKTRLGLAPHQNHWWQVVLYVTARGLGTSAMPAGERLLEVEFDFLDHRLVAKSSDGRSESLPLGPRTVADFYRDYREMLRSLDVHVPIRPMPSEIPGAVPFDQDHVHGSYDGAQARRFWEALVEIDRMLLQFRSRFIGKCSPVHFWWGSFDISCTRFSGKRAPRHPGGVPMLPDWITREAYSHECISAGWWPGNAGGPVTEPAFYAYAYPEPAGCPEAKIRPEGAYYNMQMREWILPYAAVTTSTEPDRVVLDFLESTYETAAVLGGWDRAALERPAAVARS
jgi:hypothetical protein